MTNSCLKCGAPIAEKIGGAGRPKSYCSTACRRAAELEVRRINDRLANLEGQLMRTRLKGHLCLTPAAQLEAEISRQEARLKQLLGEAAANTPG